MPLSWRRLTVARDLPAAAHHDVVDRVELVSVRRVGFDLLLEAHDELLLLPLGELPVVESVLMYS